jgi:hypothetical protein
MTAVANVKGSPGWKVFAWLAALGFVIFTVREAWNGADTPSIIWVAEWVWDNVIVAAVQWVKERRG